MGKNIEAMGYNGVHMVDAIIKTALKGVQIVAYKIVKKEVKNPVKKPVIKPIRKAVKKSIKKQP